MVGSWFVVWMMGCGLTSYPSKVDARWTDTSPLVWTTSPGDTHVTIVPGDDTARTDTGDGSEPTLSTGDTGAASTEVGDTGWLHTADTGTTLGCPTTVIAHRGASGDAPEDTLAALELAFARGVPVAEVDVRVSSDGQAFLFHDLGLERTTARTGLASALPLWDLMATPAGSWRGEAWADETIPSLADALRVADRYGATLYIDPKSPAVDAVVMALEESGVPSERLWISLGDIFQLDEYRKRLPDVSTVWWGGIPVEYGTPEFDVAGWFDELLDSGVFATEHSWIEVLGDDRFEDYAADARAAGLEVWTYTVNNRDAMRVAVEDLALDGIETDFPAVLLDIACLGGDGGPEPTPRILGTWHFDGDLFPVSTGSQLVPWGGAMPEVGTSASHGLPALPGGDAGVLYLSDPGAGGGIRLFPNAVHSGVGDGLGINRWTLLVDLFRPASATEAWTPLMQTNQDNLNDAEVYLRPGDGAIGVLDQYVGEVRAETWARVAVVVDTSEGPGGTMWVYVDGVEQGGVALEGGVDSRFALNSTWAYSESLLFTDSGAFTSDIYVSAVQLHERALSAEEVAALGGPSASGLPE